MSKGRVIPPLVIVRSFALFPGDINTTCLLVTRVARDWAVSLVSWCITFAPFSDAGVHCRFQKLLNVSESLFSLLS